MAATTGLLRHALVLVVAMSPAAASADEASFKQDVLPIVKRHCLMCHLPGAESGGLSLHPDAWASVVGIASHESSLKLVEPGAPDRSYLYLKLVNAQESAGGGGLQMPPAQPLADGQLAVIRRWIEQGAKQD